jgi:hypothetical protein
MSTMWVSIAMQARQVYPNRRESEPGNDAESCASEANPNDGPKPRAQAGRHGGALRKYGDRQGVKPVQAHDENA